MLVGIGKNELILRNNPTIVKFLVRNKILSTL